MLFVLSVSLCCIIWGIVLERNYYIKSYKSGYIKTNGVVVDHKQSSDDDSVTYSSIIEYDVNGQKYRHVSVISSSSKQPLGKIVKVKYDPNNPVNSIISTEHSGFILIIFGVILLLCLLIPGNNS